MKTLRRCVGRRRRCRTTPRAASRFIINENIIRAALPLLPQARARVDLREEATTQDANDVISLVKHSLMDTFCDEFGNIELSRSINGSGISSRNKLKKFLDLLTRRSRQLNKDTFTRQEMIQIHKSAGIAGDANDLIEAMHIHSYLLLKGSNTYQLIAI